MISCRIVGSENGLIFKAFDTYQQFVRRNTALFSYFSSTKKEKSAYFLTQLPTLNMTMFFSTYTIKNSICVCDKHIFPDWIQWVNAQTEGIRKSNESKCQSAGFTWT